MNLQTQTRTETRPGPPRGVDFAQAPFLTIWETTRSCALACRHCRASAQPFRDPRELTTSEAFGLIDQVSLGPGDLAIQQQVLGRNPHHIRKSPVEVERAQMNAARDLHQRRSAVELLVHKPHRRDHARHLVIRLEVRGPQQTPLTAAGLETEENHRRIAQRRE